MFQKGIALLLFLLLAAPIRIATAQEEAPLGEQVEDNGPIGGPTLGDEPVGNSGPIGGPALPSAAQPWGTSRSGTAAPLAARPWGTSRSRTTPPLGGSRSTEQAAQGMLVPSLDNGGRPGSRIVDIHDCENAAQKSVDGRAAVGLEVRQVSHA